MGDVAPIGQGVRAGKGGGVVPPVSQKEGGQSPGDAPAASRGQEVLGQLIHGPGSAWNMGLLDAPTRGHTSCIGKLEIELRSGKFNGYLFETTTFGDHVIALTMGDLSDLKDNPQPFPIRIHSECITSETLCGCDCDCVEQLNGALDEIGREGRGVLFYMRQEGRGAGYGQKGRDRMAVAASEDQLGTYEVYRHMGLPGDARQYDSIKDVVYLLGLEGAKVNLLTNNPDKVAAFEGNVLGLEMAGRAPIAYQSNPQNAHYLRTKGESGHMLDDGQRPTARYPWPVKVFAPQILPDVQRFRLDAEYPLPIRPKDFAVVIPSTKVLELRQALGIDTSIIEHVNPIGNSSDLVRVQFNPELLRKLRLESVNNPIDRTLADVPYWFNDRIYHDRTTQLDFVVLEYSRPEAASSVPLVRIHSESLLSRFPLKEDRGSSVYAGAVQRIVEHGRGMVLLYPEDGRGNGVAAVWKERELLASGRAKTVEEACDILGISVDDRDYRPVARLIKHHYGTGPIDLIFGTRDSVGNNSALLAALAQVGIGVRNFSTIEQ